MKLEAIVHKAEEGGFWAEIPAIPGCVTQGDSFEKLLKNIYESVDSCLHRNNNHNLNRNKALDIC